MRVTSTIDGTSTNMPPSAATCRRLARDSATCRDMPRDEVTETVSLLQSQFDELMRSLASDEPIRTDDAKFSMMAGHLKTIAVAVLTEFFGERCPDFEPDCECCKRWQALDVLIANPFKE